MNWLKRTICMLLTLSLLAVTASCTKKTTDPGADPGSTSGGGVAMLQLGFDDLLYSNYYAGAAGSDDLVTSVVGGKLLYANLEKGTYDPWLLGGWTVSDDGLVWTFTVRDTVWQDGEKLTADDFVFSVDYFQREGFTFEVYWNQYRAIFGAEFEVVDETTFTVTMPEPTSVLLDEFYLSFRLIPKHIWEDVPPEEFLTAPAAELPVGAGPFKFVEYVRGEYLRLEANETYWGGRPKLDGIIYKVIPDSAAAVAALEAGELTLLQVQADDYNRLSVKEGFKGYHSDGGSTWYYILNLEEEKFQDVRVRQALTTLIDQDTIINTLFGGYAYKSDTVIPPQAFFHNPDVTVKYPYSIENAQALLEEAGYSKGADGFYQKDGEPLEITVVQGSDALMLNISMIVQESYKQAGINMKIEQEETTRERLVAGDYDFIFGGYNLGNGPYGYNGVDRFQTDEIAALWNAGKTALTTEDQKAAYDAVQKYYSEECRIITICQRDNLFIAVDNFYAEDAVFVTDNFFEYYNMLRFG